MVFPFWPCLECTVDTIGRLRNTFCSTNGKLVIRGSEETGNETLTKVMPCVAIAETVLFNVLSPEMQSGKGADHVAEYQSRSYITGEVR